MSLIPNENTDSTITIVELHPQEVELLKALRNKWRFGEVTIMMREGIPHRLVRVFEFIDLKTPKGT